MAFGAKAIKEGYYITTQEKGSPISRDSALIGAIGERKQPIRRGPRTEGNGTGHRALWTYKERPGGPMLKGRAFGPGGCCPIYTPVWPGFPRVRIPPSATIIILLCTPSSCTEISFDYLRPPPNLVDPWQRPRTPTPTLDNTGCQWSSQIFTE